MRRTNIWFDKVTIILSLGLAHVFTHAAESTQPRPPTVTIISPPDGAIFTAPVDIRVFAEASDSDGEVKSVQFFEGTNSLGIAETEAPVLSAELEAALDATSLELPPLPKPFVPYRVIWTNAPPGTHILTAVATDNSGSTATSSQVRITVNPPEPAPTLVSIVATDPVASEGPATGGSANTALFTIHRTGETATALEVHYRLGGTASNGLDYRELVGAVTVPAGARSTELVVDPVDDGLAEGTETIVIRLESPPCIAIFPPPPGCYLLGRQNEAKAEIRDNDRPSANRPPIVSLLRPFDHQVFLAPANVKLVASAWDFDGKVNSVEFFEGENSLGFVTNQTVAATGSSRSDRMPLPFFELTWSNVPPGRFVLTALAKDNLGGTARSRAIDITVTTKVPLPVVSIKATDDEGSEGGATSNSPNTASFTISRTGGTNSALTVHYRVGGTAKPGADYQELAGRLIIPAGSRTAEIVVKPMDDDIVEGKESVIATLEPSDCLRMSPLPEDCYRVGESHAARVTLLDNDGKPNVAPKVVLTKPSAGSRFVAPAEIELRAETADPDGWVSLVEFFAGDKKIGELVMHFIQAPPSGEIQTFTFKWSSVTPGKYALTVRATDNQGNAGLSKAVEIQVGEPNALPVVSIQARDGHAAEASGNSGNPNAATFRIRRDGNLEGELRVYYSISGSASNTVDYATLPGSVTIPRGEKWALLTLTPIDDDVAEATETVVLKLELPPGVPENQASATYLLGRPDKAAATIDDNDSRRSACVRLHDGHFVVCMPGLKDQTVRIETSDDLMHWEVVETNTVAEDDLHFVDADSPKHGRRYYRVVRVPKDSDDY
ncbi:MAG: hypothetical protein HY735_21410 [Verrucomicrobia bacterium]|nr:hypothetical protein [Verrucomicrobiota bacterium]